MPSPRHHVSHVCSAICERWGLSAAEAMLYLSSEPPMVEVEEEERSAQGKLTGGIKYTMVREDGPRRVASVPGASDADDFATMSRGLGLFGLSAGAIDDVWRVVSAVALLGNVVFVPQPGLDREVAVVADETALQRAATAFGCAVEALRLPMVRKEVSVAGEAVAVEFTCKAAVQARDALSRVVYGTLFDQIVAQINEVSQGCAREEVHRPNSREEVHRPNSREEVHRPNSGRERGPAQGGPGTLGWGSG